MPPPPVPKEIRDHVISQPEPQPEPRPTVPPLVPRSVRDQVSGAGSAGHAGDSALIPPSPGVRAAEPDPRKILADKQRRRRARLGCGCISSPKQRGARSRRPGSELSMADRRTFSPGVVQPPESPRGIVRGASAARAKRTVVLAYHPASIDALFATLAAWLRYRNEAAVSLRYLALDPCDSVAVRLAAATALVNSTGKPEACKLYLLGAADASELAQSLAQAQCEVVRVPGSSDRAGACSCAALEHFDRECATQLPAAPSGRGAALLQASGFGGDESRLLELYRYVEDHQVGRHELPDSRAFASGLASTLQTHLPWDPGAASPGHEATALFDVLLSLRPETLIENGRVLLRDGGSSPAFRGWET